MIEYIPIVFVCKLSMQTLDRCDDKRAIDKVILEPVNNPMKCLIAGWEKEVELVGSHQGIALEFGVKCDIPDRKKV